MTVLVLALLGYIALVGLVLASLHAVARTDEAVLPSVQVDALGEHAALGRIAADVHALLGAERVTVIVAAGTRHDCGLVSACIGAPGLLGARVPLPAETATGVLDPESAGALGLPPGASWSFANLPLDGPEGVVGAIGVATRRPTAFTRAELERIVQLARRGAPAFERRYRARTAN